MDGLAVTPAVGQPPDQRQATKKDSAVDGSLKAGWQQSGPKLATGNLGREPWRRRQARVCAMFPPSNPCITPPTEPSHPLQNSLGEVGLVSHQGRPPIRPLPTTRARSAAFVQPTFQARLLNEPEFWTDSVVGELGSCRQPSVPSQ